MLKPEPAGTASKDAASDTSLTAEARVTPVRGWHERKNWLWILLFCGIGIGLFLFIPHLLHPKTGIEVSVGGQTLTSGTLGKDVKVSGDKDMLTLQGNCPALTVTGNGSYIRVEGTVRRVITDDDSNIVVYTQGPAPALSGNGKDNRVERLSQ